MLIVQFYVKRQTAVQSFRQISVMVSIKDDFSLIDVFSVSWKDQD